MFGQTTIGTMPNFYNYDLWDKYMGQLWLGLIKNSSINKTSTIVEVAPGATSKIAQALAMMGFEGKIYIIEPHNEVSKIIYEKTIKLLPKAKIILEQKPFNEIEFLDKIDAVVANHPFDDFLSAYMAGKNELDTIFQDISNESSDVLQVLKSIWARALSNPEQLQQTKLLIKNDWLHFIEKTSPQSVILSQYASSYFDKNDLSTINFHAKDLFKMIDTNSSKNKPTKEIQKILNKNENYQNNWIGTELLNAQNWIMYER